MDQGLLHCSCTRIIIAGTPSLSTNHGIQALLFCTPSPWDIFSAADTSAGTQAQCAGDRLTCSLHTCGVKSHVSLGKHPRDVEFIEIERDSSSPITAQGFVVVVVNFIQPRIKFRTDRRLTQPWISRASVFQRCAWAAQCPDLGTSNSRSRHGKKCGQEFGMPCARLKAALWTFWGQER